MTHLEPTADVAASASVGAESSVWHLAQIREGARIGRHCVVGRGVYVGPGVQVGDNCKLQNYALIYEPAVLEDGVFIGPAVVFTNDHHPRAVSADHRPKAADDWEAVGVTVRQGASVGANAVCIAPMTIGAWAMVGAGAVVTGDVGDHALVAGVPARRIGWVGRSGRRLEPLADHRWRCPETGELYVERDGALAPTGDVHRTGP